MCDSSPRSTLKIKVCTNKIHKIPYELALRVYLNANYISASYLIFKCRYQCKEFFQFCDYEISHFLFMAKAVDVNMHAMTKQNIIKISV